MRLTAELLMQGFDLVGVVSLTDDTVFKALDLVLLLCFRVLDYFCIFKWIDACFSTYIFFKNMFTIYSFLGCSLRPRFWI